MSGYPRPITSIHQIEPTTFCNLRCSYCPSPKLDQPRFRGVPRAHIDLDTYAAALDLAQHYQAKGTQGELSLTGIGETLLHPDWKTLVAHAREALPTNYINFSTNGLLLDDDACEHLAAYNVRVWVSLHRPEKANFAIQRALKWGILDGGNAGAGISSFDWAGQVTAPVLAPASPCEWLRQGWGAVLVDGRISTCCLDAAAKGIIGTVHTPPAELHTQPFSLCEGCHMTVPDIQICPPQ